MHGRAKPAPGFNCTRCDTSASGSRISKVFVMFTIKASRARDEWSQLGAVGGHGVPNSCIEKEFSCIKGVRGDNIQDALFHLAVFPGAKPGRPLVVVSGIPWSDKLRDDDLQSVSKPASLQNMARRFAMAW